MRIVAVANQKGGCGKTTTAINLAACLAFVDKRVLLVDLDPQGHASLGLGIAPEDFEYTLYDVLSPRVQPPLHLAEAIIKLSPRRHLLPSDLTLAALEQELSGLPGRERRLAAAFDSLGEPYDYVFIDCAPGLGILTFNALFLADEVLVPTETSMYSLHGMARFLDTVRLAEEQFEKRFTFHALVTNYDGRTRSGRHFLSELRLLLDDVALKAVIRRTVRLVDAATAGKPIVDFDRRSTAFQDYMACVTELIGRIEAQPDALKNALAAKMEPDQVENIARRITDEIRETDAVAVAESPSAAGSSVEPSGPFSPVITVGTRSAPEEAALAGADEDTMNSEDLTDKPFMTLRLRGPIQVDGGTLFSIRASAADSVMIAGEFNHWEPAPLKPNEKNRDLWETCIDLGEGSYRYKYIVNGEWKNDPHSSKTLQNPFGGVDSVVDV